MTTCLLSLGSNLGDRAALLDAAVARIQTQNHIGGFAESRRFETAPIGGPAGQNFFVNSAARLETTLAPDELLACLQSIERELGRERKERWGARVVDLDILLYGQQIVTSPSLQVPHPRMTFRRFVLEPAVEVGASMIHPITGWTVQRLWENLFSSKDSMVVTGDDLALCDSVCRQVFAKLEGTPASATKITVAARESTGQPKLVVNVYSAAEFSSLRCAGPVLNLPATDELRVVEEIAAAALAMC